jgi:hypothetical protein
MSDRILLISNVPGNVMGWLEEWTSKYDVAIYTANTGLEGLQQFEKLHPILTIIDACLSDLNGMSLASIIKDTQAGDEATIYLYNLKKILQNTKADFYFVVDSDRELYDSMQAQLHSFLEKRSMEKMHSSEILRAEKQQYDQLPSPIENNVFKVSTLFSPMAKLSGDCYDYWTGEDDSGLYGFLFDCTGHDIVSFSQVGMIRSFLKKSCKMFQIGLLEGGTSGVLTEVNGDLFTVDTNPTPVAAIVFYINFRDNTLEYCTAGIPSFFIRQEGEIKIIESSNFLLGFLKDSQFHSKTMPLDNIDEIIFSSDGFSELLFHNDDIQEADIAKHDDVSAITVWLKRSSAEQPPQQEGAKLDNVIALN